MKNKTSSRSSNLTSGEKWFVAIASTAILGLLLLMYPCTNKVVVKKISNGKIWGKDVKTGTDKIYDYNTNNVNFNYVVAGDTLPYSVPLFSLKSYKKTKIADFGTMHLNSDSLYSRKQRELFNRELQQMSEKQK